MNDFLSPQEKIQLQKVLGKSSQLRTAEDRMNFFVFCGLEKYCQSLQIAQPFDRFFISIYNRLSQDYIILDGSSKLALVVFLEYLIDADSSLSQEDKQFLEYIINKLNWKSLCSQYNSLNDICNIYELINKLQEFSKDQNFERTKVEHIINAFRKIPRDSRLGESLIESLEIFRKDIETINSYLCNLVIDFCQKNNHIKGEIKKYKSNNNNILVLRVQKAELESQIKDLENKLKDEQFKSSQQKIELKSQIEDLKTQLNEEKSKSSQQKIELESQIEDLKTQLNEEKSKSSQQKIELESQIEDVENKLEIKGLLSKEQWKDANKETAKIMLEIIDKKSWKKVTLEDINNFPDEKLYFINQLWEQESDKKFGFSVQKKIWDNLNKKDIELKCRSFGEKVGWYKDGKWLDYSQLEFDRNKIPEGHFPILGIIGFKVNMFMLPMNHFDDIKISKILSAIYKKFN